MLAPKVHGTLVLSEVLAGQPLDFLALFSSVTSATGGPGQADYCAANAFADAYARQHAREHGRTIAIGWGEWLWDAWQEGLQGFPPAVRDELIASRRAHGIAFDEGAQALERALASDRAHLFVTTQEVTGLVASNRRITAAATVAYLDQQRQLQPSHPRPQLPSAYAAPRGDWEQRIARLWEQTLGIAPVGLEDNFFDLGGNSLIGLQMVARLKEEFKIPVPAVALYEAPTVRTLATYLRPEHPTQPEHAEKTRLAERRRRTPASHAAGDIAIIGMTGRFPGADSVDQFWRNLTSGTESVTRFSDEDLRASGIAPAVIKDPNYVKARPILSDVERFDAALFGYTPRQAELLDPQQRLFQECAWEALERSGYDPQSYPGLIGVFGGTNLNTYLMRLAGDPRWSAELGEVAGFDNDKDSLATNVSFRLNLRGPSVTVQTFCSTSLVATHLACRTLRNGECDLALAGGVSVHVPVKVGYLYQEGNQASSDGHCRTFDARADGTLFGDGVAVVVLKRLADALEDGDIIHAVIKGSAVNNDGGLKAGYTAPSVVGQSEVVAMALADAGVDADSIEYVEAHGTATRLGDPIEVASLTKAFRTATEQRGYCAIGSVKPNVGHLDRAAGVTGLIKTAMALEREAIPPTLHFERPNPEIDFDGSPFHVATALTPWLRSPQRPRRASVNSLGVGGTNAHVIVEEAPALKSSGPSRPWQMLVLSARTATALDAATDRLRAHLAADATIDLADVAYTLQIGRRVLEHRRMLVCRDRDDAIALLGNREPDRVSTAAQKQARRDVTFVFASNDDASRIVGSELYEHEPVYRA
ncbi:MAG: beta-ketoacyl synthase N-terminal-like domain-containing protein, partial [Longimicrobiales bacterium]